MTMKTSLSHLPQHKQQELRTITQAACKLLDDVEFIILFGSYARGDWVEERADDEVHFKYQSDYDILVITRDANNAVNIEYNSYLQEELRRRIKTPLTIIAESIRSFNKQLQKNQYFFSDIREQGACLFDAGNFALSEPKALSAEERQQLAQSDYDHWFKGAVGFYKSVVFNIEQDELSIAAFLLHQVTERLYSAILLVFSRYKPSTHDLRELRRLVNSQAPVCLKIFPCESTEEKRLFDLLRKAYVDARYDKNYTITRDDLTQLQAKIDQLKVLTEQLCQEKIASFVASQRN